MHPTTDQLQAGVDAYMGWVSNLKNECSSAFGGNVHDLARRVYEAMINAAPQEISAEASSRADGEASEAKKPGATASTPCRTGEAETPCGAAPMHASEKGAGNYDPNESPEALAERLKKVAAFVDGCSTDKRIPAALTVWSVENKTTRALFASEEAARAYVTSHPASVSGGMTWAEVPVFGATTAPSAIAAPTVPASTWEESNRCYLAQFDRAEALLKALNAKQAELDRVMLEYCPDEMSAEQKANWAKHQRAAADRGSSRG